MCCSLKESLNSDKKMKPTLFLNTNERKNTKHTYFNNLPFMKQNFNLKLKFKLIYFLSYAILHTSMIKTNIDSICIYKLNMQLFKLRINSTIKIWHI